MFKPKIIILLFSFAVCKHFVNSEVLTSPKVTDFGRWGRFENCSNGLFVSGFQLKVEDYQRRTDNTALNMVLFHCGGGIFKSLQNITSSIGSFGTEKESFFCNSYAIGFQLKSQEYQGRNRDDVAAINFKLICADGKEIEGYQETNREQYSNSSYTAQRVCKPGKAICGLQTQVERRQLLGKTKIKDIDYVFIMDI